MIRIYQLRELSRPEMEKFFDWFIWTMPERLDAFFEFYRETNGTGDLDFQPESLAPLAHWLAVNVEYRRYSSSEMEQIRSSTPSWFHSSLDKPILADEWEEHCFAVGAYFGSIFSRSNGGLLWSLSESEGIDDGQPVIVSPTTGRILPPLQIMRVTMLGILRYPDPAARMISVYDLWVKSLDLPGREQRD